MLEAVLLAVRPTALIESRDAGSAGAARLLDYKGPKLDDAISAILTVNTISHTIGATLAGAQAAHVVEQWGWSAHESLALGVFSAILTALVLFLSEIVPKTLGAVYGSSIAGPVGHVLHWLVIATAPILLLTRLLTRLVARRRAEGVSRREVRAFLSLARGEGALARDEERWHANLLRLDRVRVADVLTPRTVVQMLPETATIDDLLAKKRAQPFSRIPLHRGSPDEVSGYVFQGEVLRAFANGTPGTTPLSEFARPVRFVPETATIRAVLRELLDTNLHFAMVVDEHGGLEGLVSLEDLTETVFDTEIIDEADRVTDMRAEALRLRDRRLRRVGLSIEEKP